MVDHGSGDFILDTLIISIATFKDVRRIALIVTLDTVWHVVHMITSLNVGFIMAKLGHKQVNLILIDILAALLNTKEGYSNIW